MTIRWLILPCLVGCVLLAGTAHALPRFSALTGSKCQSCHINPSGGSMRQMLGAQYGREALPVPTWSQDFEIEDFTTALTNFLGVGADFRTLFFTRQSGDSAGSQTGNAFWQMQGDLYLNFRVAKKVSLFLRKGLYSGFEAFGLLNVLPANGHIKIGKFVPNYGLKIDDHTAFTRVETGFSPEAGRPELTGLETGISPGPVSATIGLFNSTDGFGGSGGSEKALLGRVEGLFGVSEKVFLGAGANIFRRYIAGGTHSTTFGGFGLFGAGEFSLIGEADWVESTSQSETVTGVVLYAEANYVVTPGLDLKVAYDFYDPDKDLKTGSQSRYSFGFEFFPIAGVEVRPMYRLMREEPTDVTNDEFHLLFHIYI